MAEQLAKVAEMLAKVAADLDFFGVRLTDMDEQLRQLRAQVAELSQR